MRLDGLDHNAGPAAAEVASVTAGRTHIFEVNIWLTFAIALIKVATLIIQSKYCVLGYTGVVRWTALTCHRAG